MENSGFLIKPEIPEKHYDDVCAAIQISGQICITAKKIIVLSVLQAQNLYLEGPEIIRTIAAHHLANKKLPFYLVEGENAIEQLYQICGTSTDPQRCKKGTIRYVFGRTEPLILPSGKIFYFNGIHRPVDNTEAEHLVELFKSLNPVPP